ncbi:MAG: AraC family transcriptional regulator [Deltaproteobacteria bacterium]|nr:AraC family transcriptional regulator [Deltaproteobacteria bacterium]
MGHAKRQREVPSFPAIHALHVAELVSRWGVETSALLKGSGLKETELSQPGVRVPVPAFVALVERARALTGEPGLGVYFGLQMRASWHGYLGLAVMTAGNVGQALELAQQFLPTQTRALAFELEVANEKASLVIREQYDLGPARDAIVLALVVGMWKLSSALTGQTLGGRAEVAFPEPGYMARLRHVAPPHLSFGAKENRLSFEARMLQTPFTSADPAALQLTREQCERELEALGFDGPFRERVRALVMRRRGGVRSLEEVCAELQMSARTLKRRLADADTSYSELLDGEREKQATALLKTTALSMDVIAERLGYSDVANFTRAYRRWTRATPGAVRRGERGRR